ncbi:MAG: hypothetical protein IPQ24_03115 [Anaeromyxobacter sp.]|nr:hypothetical protein [Anaeromyxobacter sp.]
MDDQACRDTRELDAIVRDYRVRSETNREVVREGERRRTSVLEVKIWATLPRGAARLPDAPDCREAVRSLLRVAGAALAAGGQAPLAELEPFRTALYDSRQHPGCDELCLSARLPLRFGEAGAEDDGREARLRELKRRLEALGIFEGRWRARPEAAAEAVEDPWQVRPAAVAFATRAEPAGPGLGVVSEPSLGPGPTAPRARRAA